MSRLKKKKSSCVAPKRKSRQKSSSRDAGRTLSPLAKTLRQHGIPAGLEFLAITDQVIAVEGWEEVASSDQAVFRRWQRPESGCRARYTLKNGAGQTIFYVVEQQLSAEELSSGRRTMSILVLNHHGHVVLHAHTTTTYLSSSPFLCCWPLARLEVVASKGRPMGSVQQSFRGRCCCISSSPVFKVADGRNRPVMRMCPAEEGGGTSSTAPHFELLTNDGEKIGYVTRDFPGLFNDVYNTSVVGGVKFPSDLHVHIKAVLLASVFFFDKLYYRPGKEEQERESIV